MQIVSTGFRQVALTLYRGASAIGIGLLMLFLFVFSNCVDIDMMDVVGDLVDKEKRPILLYAFNNK